MAKSGWFPGSAQKLVAGDVCSRPQVSVSPKSLKKSNGYSRPRTWSVLVDWNLTKDRLFPS